MTRRQRRGTAGYGGEGTSAVRADQPRAVDDLADRPALSPRTGDRDELRQRLWRLPPGHPSSLAEAEANPAEAEAQPAEAQRTPAEPERTPRPREHAPDRGPPTKDAADSRPLTDAEHAEHVAKVRELLDKARADGLATELQYTTDPDHEQWSEDRTVLQDAIIADLYRAAVDAPCGRLAILAGGLPGAGKSTVLDKYAGVERSQYLTINPDKIKEEMAERGMIPKVAGLTPMEASDLVHEESSYVAKQLALRAMPEGKNVIWDITMSSFESTEERINDLRTAGYSPVNGIFVDIPPDVAIRRSDARHREGHDSYRAGHGYGGRIVPAEVTACQADPDWGSRNRRTFEQVKPLLDTWLLCDNSVDGRGPVTVDSGSREEDRR
jgi:predicted kinase